MAKSAEKKQELEKLQLEWNLFFERNKAMWQAVWRFTLDKPTSMLTVCYLYVLFVNALYDVAYYWYFGINIFLFASIEDFLLGPLNRVWGILLSVVGLMYLGTVVSFFYCMGSRPKKEQGLLRDLMRSNVIAAVLFIIVVPMLLGLIVAYFTPRILDRPVYSVALRSGARETGTLEYLYLVGSTSDYFFFKEVGPKKRVYTIPVSNVAFVTRSDD